MNVRTLCRIFPVLLMVFCTTYVFIVNGAYINRPIFSIFFAEVVFACLLTKLSHFILVQMKKTFNKGLFFICKAKKSFNCIFIIMRSINQIVICRHTSFLKWYRNRFITKLHSLSTPHITCIICCTRLAHNFFAVDIATCQTLKSDITEIFIQAVSLSSFDHENEKK